MTRQERMDCARDVLNGMRDLCVRDDLCPVCLVYTYLRGERVGVGGITNAALSKDPLVVAAALEEAAAMLRSGNFEREDLYSPPPQNN